MRLDVRVAITATIFLAFFLSARAEGLPDRERILDCLSEHEDAARCQPLLLAPCAYRVQQGLGRACTYRLRQHWEHVLKDAIMAYQATLPGPEARSALNDRAGDWAKDRKATCPLPRDNPATASARRNVCRIVDLARRWHWLEAKQR